ncbi:hypothetical protein PPUN109347_16520 [Pseudomonas putida]|nr:hypothetical protein PPUN109347_16520 [Pseudomonas putida]
METGGGLVPVSAIVFSPPTKRYDDWYVVAESFLAPVRSSAARAAHREQARSYICFGPVIREVEARVPLAYTSILCQANKAVVRDGTGDTGPKQM